MKRNLEVQDSHKRLDTFLTHEMGISKNQAALLIKNSLILLNSNVCLKAGQRLKMGDNITILPPPKPQKQEISQMDLEIEIVYEDEDILILNKPPHLVVHSAPSVKDPTLVDWLKYKGFALSNLAAKERYGIVHRLDKDTSGAIIVAKSNLAHTSLSLQLKSREMGRYYLAVIQGEIKPILIESKIGRNPKNRLKMANLDGFRQKNLNAREAKSTFVPLLKSKDNALSLIGAKLYTGRTHQIRVHLEGLSRHIIGDKLYGKQDSLNTRMLLHAYLIYFLHPRDGKKMLFRVPVFDDMLEFLYKNFDEAGVNEATKPENILHYFDSF